VLGLLFVVGVVALMLVSLHRTSGPLAAALGLLLLAVPEYVLQGTYQIADVPVGYFVLLAIVLLAEDDAGAARLALAGVALGFAAWTKNEGLVPALGLPLAYSVVVMRRRGLSAGYSSLVDIVIGLGPVLVALALFKILVAPVNDIVEGVMRPGVLGYWLDGVRVSYVARYMATHALTWGGWSGIGPLPLIAVLALLPRARSRMAVQTAAAFTVAFQVLAFFVVYVMTPHSVAWHTETSWARLIAQMWPSLVWLACVRHAPRESDAFVRGGGPAQTPVAIPSRRLFSRRPRFPSRSHWPLFRL
jgi:hypothetical protein